MRRWQCWLRLVLAAAAGILAGCRTPPSPAGDATEDIPARLSLPRESAAFAEALAYFSQGLIYEYHDEYGAALTNYQRAVALDPENEELHLRLAMGLLQQKRGAEAVAVMERFVARRPQSRKGLLWLALLYRATNQPEQTERVYERLVQHAPAEPAGYIELAAIYAGRNETEKAVQILERGLSQTANSNDILRALAALHVRAAISGGAREKEARARQAAIKTLEQILQSAPRDVAILYQLGDMYILDQQIEKAVACFEQIEKQHPDNLQIKQKLALSFIAVGDREKAVRVLEQVARRDPGNPRVFYYLGELYEDMGQTNQAILNFEFAASADNRNPAPYLKIALLKLDRDPDEAVAALEQGLKKMPDDPRLLEMLAYIYLARRQYPAAADHFARAYRVLETNANITITPNFYFNYAVARQKSGQPDDAAALLAKAIEINPLFLDAYLQYTLRQAGDPDQRMALRILEAIARAQPDMPEIQIHLGTLYSYFKDFPKAVAAFEKAEQLIADNPDKQALRDDFFYFWYAAACERAGRYEQAERLFLKSIEMDPENAEAYNYLAYTWAEKNIKLEQAFDYVQKALKIDPQSAAFIDTLGWIYYMQGRYREALAEINRALEILPDDATIVEHLGDVLQKLGDTPTAILRWKRAFILDPTNEKLGQKLIANGVDLAPLRREAEKLKQRKEKRDTLEQPNKTEMDDEALPPPSPFAEPLPENETDAAPDEVIPIEAPVE